MAILKISKHWSCLFFSLFAFILLKKRCTLLGKIHRSTCLMVYKIDCSKLSHFLEVHAKEHGSNKQTASKACALSLTRQLYHYGCIEAYTGEKKKKDRPKTAPFSVEVSDELKDKLAETCMVFQLVPNLIVSSKTHHQSMIHKKCCVMCTCIVYRRHTQYTICWGTNTQ